MDTLKRLEDKVRAVLEDIPRTRDDDRELTMAVWRIFYGVNPWSPVAEVMANKTLPSQESIGRVRRMVQATEYHLRGSKAKEKIRLEAQADYLDYAKGEQ